MLVLILTAILTVLASPSIALGNVETLKATHTYVMGDHDSKDDARQRCLLEAKRKILEQAGVYIESSSQVKDLTLTKDMITSYAAAVMQVKDIKEQVGFQRENMTLTLTITAQVDLAEVRKQLAANQATAGKRNILNAQMERLGDLETQLEEMQKHQQLKTFQILDLELWNLPPAPISNIPDADVQALIALAEQGNARAQNSLGWLHKAGLGVERDRDKARQWFEKAAAGGNPMAQVQVYEYGFSLPQGRTHEGLPWLMKAAEQGNAVAQVCLGNIYMIGWGVTANYPLARHWYQKAAAQGAWYAQFNLGEFYSFGLGVPTDKVRAYMWYSLAAANPRASRNEKMKAEESRGFKAQSMNPAQVTEAQRMECEVQGLKGC